MILFTEINQLERSFNWIDFGDCKITAIISFPKIKLLTIHQLPLCNQGSDLLYDRSKRLFSFYPFSLHVCFMKMT